MRELTRVPNENLARLEPERSSAVRPKVPVLNAESSLAAAISAAQENAKNVISALSEERVHREALVAEARKLRNDSEAQIKALQKELLNQQAEKERISRLLTTAQEKNAALERAHVESERTHIQELEASIRLSQKVENELHELRKVSRKTEQKIEELSARAEVDTEKLNRAVQNEHTLQSQLKQAVETERALQSELNQYKAAAKRYKSIALKSEQVIQELTVRSEEDSRKIEQAIQIARALNSEAEQAKRNEEAAKSKADALFRKVAQLEREMKHGESWGELAVRASDERDEMERSRDVALAELQFARQHNETRAIQNQKLVDELAMWGARWEAMHVEMENLRSECRALTAEVGNLRLTANRVRELEEKCRLLEADQEARNFVQFHLDKAHARIRDLEELLYRPKQRL